MTRHLLDNRGRFGEPSPQFRPVSAVIRNDKIKEFVAIMCAIVLQLRRFISARQCNDNFVRTFASRLQSAGVS